MLSSRKLYFVSINMCCAKVKCNQCGRSFDTKHIGDHKRVCKKCKQCDFWGTSGRRGTMNQHIREEHATNPVSGHTCTTCNKTFNRPSKLQTHTCSGSGSGRRSGARSNRRSGPTKTSIPKRRRRGSAVYTCRHCGEICDTKRKLNNHVYEKHAASQTLCSGKTEPQCFQSVNSAL